jgi:anti-sigma regulatory factor (Ser/Thr protein kinase)
MVKKADTEDSSYENNSTKNILGETVFIAEVGSVSPVKDFVSKITQQQNFHESRTAEVMTALDEVVPAIIRYAHKEKPGRIIVTCSLDRMERLVVTIRDDGAPFNLLLAGDPYLNSESAPSVSTKIVRKVADNIESKRVENKNVFTLTIARKR